MGGGGGGDVLFFSEDVLIKILVCLPVISLLRFKSVCKSWRALIETPFFIDLHTTTTITFNSSSSSSNFGSFIFYVENDKNFVLSSRSSALCGGGDSTGGNVDYIGCVPCYECYDIRMSSCNGLICLHETRHELTSLWNPATKLFRTLPQQLTMPGAVIEPGWDFDDYVALGFDVKTMDYKVVLFRLFRISRKLFCRIQVYSLSSDSWRLLEGIHYLPAKPTYINMFKNHGIYMNGCYFFVGTDSVWLGAALRALVCNNSLIYSFDFTKEILTTIQCPDHDSRHDFVLTNLGAHKIALFMIQRNNFLCGGSGGESCSGASEFHECGLDYEYYHIWVLNDEQPGSGSDVVISKESWTKLHSFRKLNKLNYPSQPRGISNNGEFALISSRRGPGESELQLFNLVTGEATKDFPCTGVIRSDVYSQSLISINGLESRRFEGSQALVSQDHAGCGLLVALERAQF